MEISMILLLFLIAASYFDLRSRKIPYQILVAGTIVISIHTSSLVVGGQMQIQECATSILPGVFLFLVGYFTRKVGYADAWILCLIGLYLGITDCVMIFCGSLLLAALIAVFLLFIKRANGKTTLPYLPFLTIASLFSPQIFR
jgi:leader peptidase (prepilin peptidase)/N-methyltransferase